MWSFYKIAGKAPRSCKPISKRQEMREFVWSRINSTTSTRREKLTISKHKKHYIIFLFKLLKKNMIIWSFQSWFFGWVWQACSQNKNKKYCSIWLRRLVNGWETMTEWGFSSRWLTTVTPSWRNSWSKHSRVILLICRAYKVNCGGGKPIIRRTNKTLNRSWWYS